MAAMAVIPLSASRLCFGVFFSALIWLLMVFQVDLKMLGDQCRHVYPNTLI